jgi:hypothetical protein
MLHPGMILVGTPYGQNPQILVTDGIGGSPYGPGTLAGPDGSRQPVESELQTARNLGKRVTEVAACLSLTIRTTFSFLRYVSSLCLKAQVLIQSKHFLALSFFVGTQLWPRWWVRCSLLSSVSLILTARARQPLVKQEISKLPLAVQSVLDGATGHYRSLAGW